jgi:hypothetical protein
MSRSNSALIRTSWLLRCLTAVIVLAFMTLPISLREVQAQDDDTQRPLPLPTDDLPELSQQLELLRKLRSVMQSRENASKAAKSKEQPAAREEPKPGESKSGESKSGEPESGRSDAAKSSDNKTNDLSRPKTDPEQLSRLQDALKNMSDRLPKDFVPPSLDSIPKEDLKKALENPAIRKTMQEMLRQFARDGVIPPPAQGDSTNTPAPQLPVPPSPVPPSKAKEEDAEKQDHKESGRDRNADSPPKNESAPRDPSETENDNRNENADSSDKPTDESDPADGSPDVSDSNESKPVPPSSLKSLQNFMKKLASQSPSTNDENRAGGNSGTTTPESKPQERSGPLRRRDSRRVPQTGPDEPPGANNSPSRPLPADPREVDPAGNNSSPRSSTDQMPRDDASGNNELPQTENSRESSSGFPASGGESSGAEMPSTESQWKALQALQDVMQELEHEQQQAAQSDEGAGSSDIGSQLDQTPDGTPSDDPQSRQSQLDLLRDLMQPDEPRDVTGRNENPSATSNPEADSSISEADESFVQEFLRKELERINQERSGKGDSSTSPPAGGSNTADSLRDADVNQPPSNNSRPLQNPFNPQQPSNSNSPRGMNSDSSSPARPGTSPSEMRPQTKNAPSDNRQPSSGGSGRSGRSGSQNSDAERMQPNRNPPFLNPNETQRSPTEIQQELERRGVVETLKKTWEKSIQEARTKRQQELQKQTPGDPNSNLTRPSNLAPTDPAAMRSQLENLAKQLRDNPNSEKAISDMIGRVAKDMAEQSKSKGSDTNGSQSGSFVQTPRSSPSDKANSEFPGQSMLKGLRESMSKMLSSADGPRVTPSPSSGGGSSLSTPSLSSSFDFTPVLILGGILAAVALGFYALRAVRHHQVAEAALAGSVPPIQASQITTRADIVRAFHEMARKSTRSVQAWWTHRKVEIALTGIAPEKKQAVETLVETYEQARYLPQDHDLSPDQIQSARSALQQLQPHS